MYHRRKQNIPIPKNNTGDNSNNVSKEEKKESNPLKRIRSAKNHIDLSTSNNNLRKRVIVRKRDVSHIISFQKLLNKKIPGGEIKQVDNNSVVQILRPEELIKNPIEMNHNPNTNEKKRIKPLTKTQKYLLDKINKRDEKVVADNNEKKRINDMLIAKSIENKRMTPQKNDHIKITVTPVPQTQSKVEEAQPKSEVQQRVNKIDTNKLKVKKLRVEEIINNMTKK